jgi:L-amino acid N-acyltransferase YncA
MITCTTSSTEKDLAGIIELQLQNLSQNLEADEIQSQGFVTVVHTMDDLKKMNSYEQNIILKDDEKIAGYLLAMTKNSKSDIPVLVPMFEKFDTIMYRNQFISQYNYIVVGQVCIGKNYRGMGLLDKCYAAYKEHFKKTCDFAITEIATANQRSINAHKRIGFTEIHRYIDATNTEWSIVIWDWATN